MSGKILERYTGRPVDGPTDGATAADPDGTEDLGAFGWLRGARDRCVMLELRQKTGHIRAIPYGWIEGMDFDPSDGITIEIGGKTIRIKGLNLNAESRPQVRLFQGLTRHRVPWIQEAEHGERLRADKQATVIASISW